MDDLRPRGPGRFVLKALAILSALGFLTLVMLQAMAFYAPPWAPSKTRPLLRLRGPATKSAPVVHPPPPDRDLLWPGTKAGSPDPPPIFEFPAARRN